MKIVGHDFKAGKKVTVKAKDREILKTLESSGYENKGKTKSGEIKMVKPCQLWVRIELGDDGPIQSFDLHDEIKRVYGSEDEKIFKKDFEHFLKDYYNGKRKLILENGLVKIVFNKKRKKEK